MNESKQRRAKAALTDELAPETIGFRLEEAHRKALAQRCRKAGASPHDLARTYVVEALYDRSQIPEMQEAILTLGEQIAQLQNQLVLAVEAILVTGNDLDTEEVRAWVKKTFSKG